MNTVVRSSEKQTGSQFRTWKTVVLGRQASAAAYKEALASAGHRVIPNAGCRIILDIQNFIVSPTEKSVNLVLVTHEDLGIDKDSEYLEVCQAAADRGLELCPMEVGPALRLQFKQRAGDFVVMGMLDAADEFDCTLSFFLIKPNNKTSDLVSCYAAKVTASHIGKPVKFVFVLPD